MCDQCNAPEHKGITEEQRQALCGKSYRAARTTIEDRKRAAEIDRLKGEVEASLREKMADRKALADWWQAAKA